MASNSRPTVKLGGLVKKIDSPLAKYNSAGQLTCIVCNTMIKNEMVWTAHVNGRQHREQVLALKKPRSEPQFAKPQAASAIKRKADLPAGVEDNGGVPIASPSKKGVPADFFDSQVKPVTTVQAPKQIKGILKKSAESPNVHQVKPQITQPPAHPSATHISESKTPSTVQVQSSAEVLLDNPKSIPEGFFDDPKLDAKVHLNFFHEFKCYLTDTHHFPQVRQIEYKDPIEEEWNKFQKEINEEVTASIAIQEEDQEESTAERQLEEIEDQMAKWGRVLELEHKKEMLDQRLQALRQSTPMEEDAESSSDEDVEMDKFFDWRSKAI